MQKNKMQLFDIATLNQEIKEHKNTPNDSEYFRKNRYARALSVITSFVSDDQKLSDADLDVMRQYVKCFGRLGGLRMSSIAKQALQIIKQRQNEAKKAAVKQPRYVLEKRKKTKNKKTNKVTIYQKEADLPSPLKKDAAYIDTAFRTVETILTKNGEITLLEVQLFTGKTHQIRAQLSAMGYPVIGDRKYGSSKRNKEFYDTGVRNQLLHAYKLVFPKNSEECFADLSERTLTCELPTLFERLMTNRPNGRNEVLT